MKVGIRLEVDGLKIDNQGQTERLEIFFWVTNVPQLAKCRFAAWAEAPYTLARIKAAIEAKCKQLHEAQTKENAARNSVRQELPAPPEGEGPAQVGIFEVEI